MHSGSEHFHSVDVEPLSLHVLAAHVDLGRQTESYAGHCSRDSMLSRSSLGDDPTLSHLLCEQCLSESIVDLMSATVQEIFSLQIDLGSSSVIGQPAGEIYWGWSSGV